MRRDGRLQGKASPPYQPARVVCEVCGKRVDRSFEVHLGGEKHVFDSFECAVRGLMPKCCLCGSLLLGPGVQIGDRLYCSSFCASLYNTQEI